MATTKFFPIFVNHISEQVTPSDLRVLFSRYGPVGEVVIVSSYGFVNMLDELSSLEVISKLNGRGLFDQLLHVDFSEELKYHMQRKGAPFHPTTDPMTGLTVREHPACPTAQGIASPFPELSGSGDFQSLLDDKALLDERLKKVNEELQTVKTTGLVVPGVEERRRIRSRSRGRMNEGDRERRPGDRRDGPPSHRDHREGPPAQRDHREGPHGDHREGLASHGSHREGPPPPRRRSSPGRRPLHDRRQSSPGRRPQSPGRRPHSPGRRPHSPGRRPPSPGRRPQSPGRRPQFGRRSPERRHFDGRRPVGEGDGRRPIGEETANGRRPIGEGDGRRPSREGNRKRQSPHRGQHFNKRGMGSRGRPTQHSRERSPIHQRQSPQREASPNREIGLTIAGRPVSPLRGKVIVDVDNDADAAGEARRRFEDFDRMESWEANRLTEESPALEPPEPDLRTVLTSRRTTRQPSDEFEDSVDIDLSKKNMKIQINIDTKDLDSIDRKIVVDEDSEPVNLYQLHIEGLTKKMFPQDLYSLFGEFGTVVKADLIRDFAYVDLETTEKMALQAVDKLDGETHFGNTLSVEFKKGKKQDHLRNRDEDVECVPLSGRDAMDNQANPFTNTVLRGTQSSSFSGTTLDESASPSWDAATSSRNSSSRKPTLDSFTSSFHSLPQPVAAQAKKEQSFEGLLDTFVKATREESDHQMKHDTKPAKGWSDWIKKPDNQDSDSSVIFDGYSNMGKVIPAANSNEAQTSTQQGYLSVKQTSALLKQESKEQGLNQESYLDAKNKIGSQEKEESSGPTDPGPKAIRKFYVAGLKSYINDFDLKDLFGRYGQVNRVDGKITFSLVNIYCTELSAVQCICELNGHLIKGSRLRINFGKGSYEETKDFKEKWKKEFKLYSSTNHKKSVETVTQLPERMSLSQIGEGLKNFDMSLSIPPVHPSFQQPPPVSNPSLPTSNSSFQNMENSPFSSSITYPTTYPSQSEQSFQAPIQMPPHNATSSNQFSQISSSHYQMPPNQYPPPTSSFQQLPSKYQVTNTFQAPPAQSAPPAAFQASLPITSFPPPAMASASYMNQPQPRQNFPFRHSENVSEDKVIVLNAVQGTIHSMQNKMILLEFTSGNSNITKFAKLIPGQMFINGQTCLGVVIKSNTFHTWPKIVKDFLQIGKKVWMDVKRLSEKEMHEGKDREFKVGWTAPIAWQGGIGNKPTEDQITLNKSNSKTNIVTASVVKLFSNWGLLRHKDYDIIFRVENLYWDGAILKENMSLLTNCDLELGDIVAVHCKKTDTVQEAEGQDTSNVKFEALMVWQVSAEVDPWVYFPKPKMTSCDFLITSSTLNRQLPGEKEAEFKSLQGTVEEVHLPAGGIVKLDLKSIPAGVVPPNCAPTHERVYFHRSRVYLNGTKVQSDQSLDAELKIGDQVTVDVVRNLMDHNDPPYVMSGAHWVALSLRANTVVRGVSLAAQLRQECEDDLEELGPNVATGRIVYLNSPDEPKGAVESGVAVIDSGEYLGQRVQFDRTVCSAFGFPLAKADLSYVFSQGEKVYIEVKPYNSYCVEKLWTGFSKSVYKEQGLDMNERTVMKMYLSDHGMNTTNFDLLIKGEFTPRLYIPLQRQHFRGRIVSLQEDEEGVATGAIIKGPTGELVRAKRSVIHVFGQWMGKADLHHCMQGQDVLFEMLPRYTEGLEEHTVGLVWVGSEEARPKHPGETNLYWTTNMNNSLKIWLGEKKMDLHIFKALIDGMLPSKRKSMEKNEEKLDPEIVAQAKMLQNMKSKNFNTKAMMQAFMTMMGGSEGSSEASNYVGQGGIDPAMGFRERSNNETHFNTTRDQRTDQSSEMYPPPSMELNSMRYTGTLGEYGTVNKSGPGHGSFPSAEIAEKENTMRFSGTLGEYGTISKSGPGNPQYSQSSASNNPQTGNRHAQLYGTGSGGFNNPQSGAGNPQLYGSGNASSSNPQSGNAQLYRPGNGSSINPQTVSGNPQLYGPGNGSSSNPQTANAQLYGHGNPQAVTGNAQLYGSVQDRSANPQTGAGNPQLYGPGRDISINLQNAQVPGSASSNNPQPGNAQMYGSGRGISSNPIYPNQPGRPLPQAQAHSGYSTAALRAAGIIPEQNTSYTAPRSTTVTQASQSRGYSSGQGNSPGYFTGGGGYFTQGSPGYSTEKK